MDKRLEKNVEEWFIRSQALVDARNPAALHIDEFGIDSFDRSDWIAVGTELFSFLVFLATNTDARVKPILTIPLVDMNSTNCRNIPKNISDVQIQLGDEPPILYIVDRDINSYYFPSEEYKIPLRFQWPGLDRNWGVYIYYKEYRDEQAIQHNWPSSRSVYAEYFAPLYYKEKPDEL